MAWYIEINGTPKCESREFEHARRQIQHLEDKGLGMSYGDLFALVCQYKDVKDAEYSAGIIRKLMPEANVKVMQGDCPEHLRYMEGRKYPIWHGW